MVCSEIMDAMPSATPPYTCVLAVDQLVGKPSPVTLDISALRTMLSANRSSIGLPKQYERFRATPDISLRTGIELRLNSTISFTTGGLTTI